jgi:type IV secretion system protein VirB6
MAITTFANITTQLLQPISTYIDSAVSNLQGALDAPLKAGLVIYVMWFGWQVMLGSTPLAMSEIVKRLVRIGIITMLCLSAGSGYTTYVKQPLLTDIPEFVSSAVVQNKFTETNGSSFDKLVETAAESAAKIRQAASSWSVGAVVGAHIQSYILEVGAYIAASVGFYYVMYARIVLGMLLSVGPVFIALAFFDSTRRFFDGWLSQCANFIILQILIGTVCSVMLTMLKTVLGASFGPENPGSMAAALVTCAVMVMIFQQLPSIAHALAQGGASLNLQTAVPGYQTIRNAISNSVGDQVSKAGNTARDQRAGTGAFKGVGAQRTWGNFVLSRGPRDSRGPFRDRRNYDGRSRASSDGRSDSGNKSAEPGSNAYEESNSNRKA